MYTCVWLYITIYRISAEKACFQTTWNHNFKVHISEWGFILHKQLQDQHLISFFEWGRFMNGKGRTCIGTLDIAHLHMEVILWRVLLCTINISWIIHIIYNMNYYRTNSLSFLHFFLYYGVYTTNRRRPISPPGKKDFVSTVGHAVRFFLGRKHMRHLAVRSHRDSITSW